MQRSRTSSSGSGGIRPILGLLPPLSLQTKVDPFRVAREFHPLPRDPRNQVDVSVEIDVPARRSIHKSGIETGHFESACDAASEMRERVPNHALLLNVEVVKGSRMASRSDHQMACAGRIRMWHGDHKLRRHPRVFGRNRTILAGQANTISHDFTAIDTLLY